MSDAKLPREDELLDRLKQSVEEVFHALVIRFEESTVKPSGGAVTVELDGETKRVSISSEFGVDFEGQLSGTVAVRCTAEGAHDLARGLLMIEAGDALEIEEVEDALGECANMLTGSLKTSTLDPVGEFKLGLPYKIEDWDTDARSVVYRLTEGHVSIEIKLDDARKNSKAA